MHEQICKNTVCDLALSVPSGLGVDVGAGSHRGRVAAEVYKCVMVFFQQLDCEVVELSVQMGHIYLLAKAPPKLSITELMGVLKGRSAIRMFSAFPFLHKKPY